MIVARVIWSDDQKAGLCSQDPILVDHVVSASNAPQLQLTAEPFRRSDQRPRGYGERRLQGRTMEFASFVVIGMFFAVSVCSLVGEALAQPLAAIASALSG